VNQPDELLARIVNWLPLLLSLSVHEWAHARAAFALGDDTAARQGRLTLNPIAHIDLIGTVVLPLMGVPFGWAKPVPVNPTRFTRRISMRAGMMVTAAAGPLSNVALALIATLSLMLIRFLAPNLLFEMRGLLPFFTQAIIVNLALAAFNLLPLFPLDGSRIVEGLVPYRFRANWEKFAQISPFVLLVVAFGLPYIGINPFGWVGDVGRFMLSLALGFA
jgi:Zn-dependent protease